MLRKITLVFILSITTSIGFSQKKSKKEDEAEKPQSRLVTDSTKNKVLDALNALRKEAKLDLLEYHDLLAEASAIQAEDMALDGKASLDNSSGEYSTTEKRMISVGGTNKVSELVLSLSSKKGKEEITPEEFVEGIMKKWSGKKEKQVVINPNFVFASPSISLDESGKKVYISVVFGGYNSFNKGAGKKKRKTLGHRKARYTLKNKNLLPADEKACKDCDKFKDYEELFDGVHVEEGGLIYFKYPDIKKLKKLLSKPTDGLAVDIVQKKQYENPEYNIKDNNLRSKGVLLKTVTKDQLFDNNLVVSEKKGAKVNELEALVGKVHKKITGDYEINLLIVKDGKLCKTLTKSYVEQGDQASNTKMIMLLMPDSAAYFKPMFTPKADSAKLSFIVPFEKNKSEYKEEDMLPFLNSLQEPDFIIHKLEIVAYSSIEGDSISNVKLQQKRSENIINALKGMQKQDVLTNVITSDSWELFKESVAGGQYDTLSKMPKTAVIEQINNTPGLSDSLESLLSKQRYAKIYMEVTYDISGAKEQAFVISKFNKAVKNGNLEKAYKIQYYINDKVKKGEYTRDALSKLEILDKKPNTGLMNNHVVYNYFLSDTIATVVDYEELKRIVKLDSTNSYAVYNYLFCALEFEDGLENADKRAMYQSKIDSLYSSSIPKKVIDALNTEWQFKVISAVDTIAGSEAIIQACNDKVKSFYNIENATWENSLKLSYVFARFKDYTYAAELLKDFIKEENPNEQLLFAYISYCAQLPELRKSKAYVMAYQKAEKANHDRYCKLFGQPFLTFQVLDNPIVKESYHKAACK